MAVKVTERSNDIHFHCLFGESRFSDICTRMELKELNWLCKQIAANVVFEWIFEKKNFSHIFANQRKYFKEKGSGSLENEI